MEETTGEQEPQTPAPSESETPEEPTGNGEPTPTTPSEPSTPPVEDKEKAELEQKNKDLFARAKKAEAELKELKDKPQTPQDEIISVKRQLLLIQLQQKGLDEETAKTIVDEFKDPEKAMETDLVKTALKAKEEDKRKADAIPPPSGRTPEVAVKAFKDTPKEEREGKYGPEAWRDKRRSQT